MPGPLLCNVENLSVLGQKQRAVDLLGLLTVSAMSVTPALRHDDRLRVAWGERVESSCSMLWYVLVQKKATATDCSVIYGLVVVLWNRCYDHRYSQLESITACLQPY